MNYIIASHGKYAQATLDSCEMITGKLDNIFPVVFTVDMGPEDVVQRYQQIQTEQQLDDKDLTIIVDIKGGTPCNAAILFRKDHPDVKLFVGLSLGVLLAVATGTDVEKAFQQVREQEGELLPDGSVKSGFKKHLNQSKEPAKKVSIKDGNGINNVRIDERLIHGQVATMWTNKLGATRIMIVGDDIVKSDVQKMALKTAVPNGIHLSILTTKGAADRINNGKYVGQNVFMVVQNPGVLATLVKDGVQLKAVNVGNMSTKKDGHTVAKSVFVQDKDIDAFKYLDANNVKLIHQMVPNDSSEAFMPLLKNLD